MRAGALASLALLGACAFGAERALFGDSDAVRPFADGAQFIWSESDDSGQRFPVTFALESGEHYTISSPANDEPMRGVLFVAIEDTPEEDYIAQLRLRTDEPGVLLAYLWRTAEGYRVVVDPGRLTPDDNLSAADPFCTWSSMSGCGLTSREGAFGVYRALIYPRFVVGGEEPESYVDLLAEEAPTPAPAKETK